MLNAGCRARLSRREEAMIYFIAAAVLGACGFLCFTLGYIVRGMDDPDEMWCGCDGEGMAHIPGSKGFLCGTPASPSAAPKDMK